MWTGCNAGSGNLHCPTAGNGIGRVHRNDDTMTPCVFTVFSDDLYKGFLSRNKTFLDDRLKADRKLDVAIFGRYLDFEKDGHLT